MYSNDVDVIESSDEGIVRDGEFIDDPMEEQGVSEMLDLRVKLENEKKIRLDIEHQMSTLKHQFTQHVTQVGRVPIFGNIRCYVF